MDLSTTAGVQPGHKVAAAREGWLPKLVVSDLDGTLISHHHGLSEQHRAAIDFLAGKGIQLVPATGRGPRLLPLTRSEVGGDGYLVMGQGGVIFHGDEIVHVDSMDAQTAQSIIRQVREQVADARLGVEHAHDLTLPLLLEDGFNWRYTKDLHEFLPADALVRGPVLKLFVQSDELPVDALVRTIGLAIPPHIAEVTQSGLNFAEIVPAGVDKAKGVAYVANQLGIDAADVLCFGDQPNDLAMFGWCGRSVAMGDAHPEVVRAAEAVTDSCDEYGVYTYLRDLFQW